jgi:hypothetical protein
MRCYLSAVMLKNLNAKTIPPFQQYSHRTYYESLVLYVSIHVTIPTLTFCVFYLALHTYETLDKPLSFCLTVPLGTVFYEAADVKSD